VSFKSSVRAGVTSHSGILVWPNRQFPFPPPPDGSSPQGSRGEALSKMRNHFSE